MHIGLDKNIDTSNSVQFYFFVLVISPVAHTGHVCTSSVILLVPLGENDIFIKGVCQSSTFVRLNPRVVIEATFNITTLFISMEPDV